MNNFHEAGLMLMLDSVSALVMRTHQILIQIISAFSLFNASQNHAIQCKCKVK